MFFSDPDKGHEQVNHGGRRLSQSQVRREVSVFSTELFSCTLETGAPREKKKNKQTTQVADMDGI